MVLLQEVSVSIALKCDRRVMKKGQVWVDVRK
jgi:hypothetical protein